MKPITFVAHRAMLASFAVLLFVVIAAGTASAQTSAFTFQGRLNDTSLPANGTYTMKFVLYDDLAKGNQIGSAQSNLVTVTNGIFTTVLDFGFTPFTDGQPRWMEVIVNTIPLSPRQQVTSSPYAIRSTGAASADSISAACVLCITDAHISGIDGSKVTGAVANATNAGTALNSLNLGGVPASGYLPTTGGTISGNLSVGGVLSGNGSGLTNLPGGAFVWQEVVGTAFLAQPNHGYLANNPSLVTITLPTSPNVGDTVRVTAPGAGGWKIAQNAGQQILTPTSTVGNWTQPLYWLAVASSSDGAKLIATTNSGPYYTSTDSGFSWTVHTGYPTFTHVASSSDGTKLVAGTQGDRLYTSTDSGNTWTARDVVRNWYSVASSADGVNLSAIGFTSAPSEIRVLTSSDSGVNWTMRDSPRNWQWVASSSDGSKLVACLFPGFLFTSTDFGVTWFQRESSRTWTSVASSSDGVKLLAVTFNGQAYTSTDSGLTWTPRDSVRQWNYAASSADGTILAAVGNGQIYISTDSGITWTARESNRSWSSIAISSDGTKIVAVVAGAGQIYRSTDSGVTWNTTAKGTLPGTAGYITNVQNSAVELQYIGGGRFIVISSYGPAFTVN